MMKLKISILLFICTVNLMAQQQIGDFISIVPSAQNSDFVIPATHTFQKIIAAGDPLTEGGFLKDKNDFTGYVPINGSSENGYLSINAEAAPGGVSILDINFNGATKLWQTSASEAVDFSSVVATVANCSGAVTSWNTIVSCEEFVVETDLNVDGYNDMGWCVEINPATKTVIDKLWALGNFKHENVAIHGNERTLYQGIDDVVGPGYLYKFVADNTQDLSSGKLYVYTGSKEGSGNWVQINNTTPAERNSTIVQSTNVGATSFAGIEDVEIGPDGWVYFAVKNEARVYRFRDSDPLTGTTVPQMETYVGNASYSIMHANGATNVNWGNGNDNLAFDGQGNLWVMQDGGNQNYIWVVENGHTQAVPKVRIFGNTPSGAEPTGITFSPDYRFLFMSIQHPDPANNGNQIDAAENIVNFNKGTTLVVSRNEYLGSTALVWYLDFDEDGYAAPTTITSITNPGPGYTTTVLPTTDCDDNNPLINPETVWYLDFDNDGYASSNTMVSCASPGEGYTTNILPTTDCNDSDASVNAIVTWYLDADGDGFANPNTIDSCNSPGTGYTVNVLPATDCNDNDASVNAVVTWYLDADGDGFAAEATVENCGSPGQGYTKNPLPTTDCNDNDASVNAIATWYLDADGDGFATEITVENCGSPGQGYTENQLPTTDCNDNDASVNAIATWYLDADGDGFATETTVENCGSPGQGYTETQLPTTDCNDDDASVNRITTWYLDADVDGFADSEPIMNCGSPGVNYTSEVLPLAIPEEDTVVLYPNPTAESVQISLRKVYQEGTVSLVNLLNQSIRVEKFSDTDEISINLSILESGVYLIQITSEGKIIDVLKVVRR